MIRYVLDTNVVSAYFRAVQGDPLVKTISAHPGEMAIASVVWHELRYGWRLLPESRRKSALGDFLGAVIQPNFAVLDYDTAAADWHAEQRVTLRERGLVAPFIDGQVAAVAGVRGLVVVTENTRHFEIFRGLQVESWPPADVSA